MAAYNAGPQRVKNALDKTGVSTFLELADKRALPNETINYVPNILALTIIGTDPEKYGFRITPMEPLETERVSLDKATDLRVIAEAIGVPLDDLRTLNGHMLRMTTPPDDPDFQLVLPRGYSDAFQEKVAAMPDSDRVQFRYHQVRKGDTLSVIAKKYGTTVSELSKANKLTSKSVLTAGQSLIIPVGGLNPPVTASTASSARSGSSTTKSASSGTAISYTVKKGDTLSDIASRFHVAINDLKTWNKLASNQIETGRKLVVGQPAAPPAPTAVASSSEPHKVIHQVKAGETLLKIASDYRTTVGNIKSWNTKTDLSVLHPGDRITIFVTSTN
jgi:membrane-bound lytic murein transglycosylase D